MTDVVTLEQELEFARKQNQEKWQGYERDYIHPCFKWAKEMGIDLEALVREGKGNCVERLVKTLWLRLQAHETRIMSCCSKCNRELDIVGHCFIGCSGDTGAV